MLYLLKGGDPPLNFFQQGIVGRQGISKIFRGTPPTVGIPLSPYRDTRVRMLQPSYIQVQSTENLVYILI